MKKLPIGLQDFASLITDDNYLYVDKTEHIHRLIQSGKYIFLSRPRRFGKSLLASTLKEIFEGNRALFKGLWIEEKIAWERYPVIYVDFNVMNYRSNPLDIELNNQMETNAHQHQISLSAKDYKGKFQELLERLGGNGRKAVVLIDEYDKAITDFLDEPNDARIRENIGTLKNFYSILKSLDRCIHFAFITGVSKYGKVSIFSDLNNLYDITMDEEFAALTGWTQAELEQNFSEHLSAAEKSLRMNRGALLAKIRYWYNGYSWDGRTTLYNPFSVLNFFQAKRFANYWFKTGTPTFLTHLLKKEQIPAYQLEHFRGGEFMIESADVHNIGLFALLFQTGYLTIKDINHDAHGGPTITLSYPNWEVRHSFLQYVLAEYVSQPVDIANTNLALQLQSAFETHDLDNAFALLESLFASIPHQIARTDEAYFHSIVHVALTLTGYVAHSEIPTNKGRMDAVLDTGKHIYIFEFKLRESADNALAQIKEKGYPERFRAADKTLTLIGVAFDANQKNIKEWKIEKD